MSGLDMCCIIEPHKPIFCTALTAMVHPTDHSSSMYFRINFGIVHEIIISRILMLLCEILYFFLMCLAAQMMGLISLLPIIFTCDGGSCIIV